MGNNLVTINDIKRYLAGSMLQRYFLFPKSQNHLDLMILFR